MLSVKQLADLTGISRRTLHHYDQIGLLVAQRDPHNGYRSYSQPDLLRLQQILFYRELDVPLEMIRALLDDPDFDPIGTLKQHREKLQAEASRLSRLLSTLDHTLAHLTEDRPMSNKALFDGFDEAKQEAYAKEAAERWDPKMVQDANLRWKQASKVQQQQIIERSEQVYRDWAAAMSYGEASEQVQQIVADWHQGLRFFYEPNKAILLGLAEMYIHDPRFADKFRTLDPQLPEFIQRSVVIYCQQLND